MKNVTISLNDSVLESLRRKAKANGKSLNAWLGEILTREAAEQGAWLEEFRRIVDASAVTAPDWTWQREDAYEERLL